MPPYTTGAYIKEDRRGDQNPNYYVYSADDRSRAAHPATQRSQELQHQVVLTSYMALSCDFLQLAVW